VPIFGTTTGAHGFEVDPVEGVVVPVPVVVVPVVVPVVVVDPVAGVPADPPTFELSASVPATGVPVDIGLSHAAAGGALAVLAASWAAPTVSLLDGVRVEMPSGKIAATE
jgi:hypothetical protein